MNTNIEIKNLESQVIECYSYFMNNYQNTNFDALESMVFKLQKTMNLLTMTNIVNIIDRVVEDGRLKDGKYFRQYNVNSAYNGEFEQCFQKYLNTFDKNIF